MEEEKHIERVREMERLRQPRPARGYGPGWQGGWRGIERGIREDAVKCREEAKEAGLASRETAEMLLLSPGTLKSWARGILGGDHDWIPRGRPARPSSVEKREEVFEALKDQGRKTGVGRLQGQFCQMPRREVADLKKVWILAHPEPGHVLEWPRPGLVWAMDHTDPTGGIEGSEKALWAVRDLASRYEVAWEPVRNKRAESIRHRVAELFAEHGAPLAVKMDNGAPAKDEWLRDLFDRYGVTRLLSPGWTPEYNGSCEASIRWMKVQTSHQASRRGSQEVWSREDCEIARRLSNETSRPWGPSKPTAQEAWLSRIPATRELRETFLATLGEQRRIIQAQIAVHENILDRRVQAKIERQSVTRTLVACGLLIIRRRPIPRQLNPNFWPEIS